MDNRTIEQGIGVLVNNGHEGTAENPSSVSVTQHFSTGTELRNTNPESEK
jgi:hypothetical protein